MSPPTLANHDQSSTIKRIFPSCSSRTHLKAGAVVDWREWASSGWMLHKLHCIVDCTPVSTAIHVTHISQSCHYMQNVTSVPVTVTVHAIKETYSFMAFSNIICWALLYLIPNYASELCYKKNIYVTIMKVYLCNWCYLFTYIIHLYYSYYITYHMLLIKFPCRCTLLIDTEQLNCNNCIDCPH